ncbi:MAG TPA: hypothetical protein VNO55_23560, partial [Polyangia bacterium]|nr:hypothetical protein [Polyangia bacterium]
MKVIAPAPALAAAVAVALGVVGAGCAGPPWLMGRPLDGSPSIPASTLNSSVAHRRGEAEAARRLGYPVEEFAPLLALEALERLSPEERARLVELLLLRTADFAAMDRAIPRSQDLEHAVALAPEKAEALRAARAGALRAAGDAWLAIGERPRAREAYAQAADLGATDLSFRLLAAADEPPPANMPLGNLKQAIAALPLRVLRPFGDVYLRLRGDDRPTLQRLLAAARQDSDSTQVERLREALARAPAPETTSPEAPQSPIALVGIPAAGDLDRWVLGGPSLSRRLLPLLAASP